MEDIQRRVQNDIAWLEKSYRLAQLGEPKDEDIIWWFDAGSFDNAGKDIEGATNDDKMTECQRLFLKGMMYGSLQVSVSNVDMNS